MYDHAPGNERLVFYFRVSGHQNATCYHVVVAHFAIVRHVAVGHDEIVVPDLGQRFRLRSSRDAVVLANLVAVADTQVTALAGKGLVQRVRAKHRTSGDFITLPHRGPTFHVNVRSEEAPGADRDIPLHDAKLADICLRADDRIGMDAGSGSHYRGRINGHTLV